MSEDKKDMLKAFMAVSAGILLILFASIRMIEELNKTNSKPAEAVKPVLNVSQDDLEDADTVNPHLSDKEMWKQ